MREQPPWQYQNGPYSNQIWRPYARNKPLDIYNIDDAKSEVVREIHGRKYYSGY